ncbi:MAG: T9SS type A sorting domain-containing protein, partial [Candidatus Latescibacteria bacterium]|nr:T9SS type A sorting domain-containing protein [Candidatus Latescibacterota bacterium]
VVLETPDSRDWVVVLHRSERVFSWDGTQIPASSTLHQNAPNPFGPLTTITYEISNTTSVVLSIFNMSGVLVRTLVDDAQAPGSYTGAWNGRDNRGRSSPSGVYAYRLTTSDGRITRKMVLTR